MLNYLFIDIFLTLQKCEPNCMKNMQFNTKLFMRAEYKKLLVFYELKQQQKCDIFKN